MSATWAENKTELQGPNQTFIRLITISLSHSTGWVRHVVAGGDIEVEDGD